MPEKAIKRDELISAGQLALDQVVSRLEGRYTSKSDRLSLFRITASLITALSGVMKDKEVEDIEHRLSNLEAFLSDKKKN